MVHWFKIEEEAVQKYLRIVQQLNLACSDRELAILSTALRRLQIAGVNALAKPVCIQVEFNLVVERIEFAG